jgi:hypothetical protein
MHIWNNYIIVALAALLIIAVIFFLLKPFGKPARSSILVALAFVFMITGFLWEDQKLFGNSMLGIGIVLSIIDVFRTKIRSDN